MDQNVEAGVAPEAWLEALERGRADADSGHTVQADKFLMALKAKVAARRTDQTRT